VFRYIPTTVRSRYLRRWHSIKRGGHFLLPGHLSLAEDLSANFEVITTLLKEGGPRNDGIWTHNLLMVIDVTCAMWAVIAVHCLAGVSIVRILGWLAALSDLKIALWNDLVHAESAAAEYLACVAVTKNVVALVLVESDLPLMVTTVADALVGSHDCSSCRFGSI